MRKERNEESISWVRKDVKVEGEYERKGRKTFRQMREGGRFRGKEREIEKNGRE